MSVEKLHSEVAQVMRQNIEQVMQRGQILDEVDWMSTDLMRRSENFRRRSRIRRCIQTRKLTSFLIAVVLLVVIIRPH